jgi:hypothetical protein
MDEKMKTLRISHWIAIAGWSLITLIFLVYFLIVLRLNFAQMLAPCEGANCDFLALSPAEMMVLTSWGLSMRAYAYFMSAVMVFISTVYWALGGLIVWSRGSARIGLAISLALIVIPISTYAGSTDWATNYPNLVIPGLFLNTFGTTIMLVFFYLIPNGRFSPRWAYIPFTITLFLVALLTLQINGIVALSGITQSILGTAIVGLVILGAIFQIYRYQRDSTPLERQQIKWILFGVLTYVLGVVLWVLVFGRALEIPAGQVRLLAMLGVWFSDIFFLLSLPVAITIAIMRYRLWDIDVIIRKTLVYGALTATLGLVFFGGVTLLQQVVGRLSGTEDSPVVIVVSTLLIAALFSPLRRRIQDFIDRRFYRNKYNAEQALADFAASARNETDLDALSSKLVEVVSLTMQPEQVILWLKSQRRQP